MKKYIFFWVILVACLATIVFCILGVCQGKVGMLSAIPSCIVTILFDFAVLSANKVVEWHKERIGQLEAENEELKKAVSVKDEAIRSYKWDIESLKRKIR